MIIIQTGTNGLNDSVKNEMAYQTIRNIWHGYSTYPGDSFSGNSGLYDSVETEIA